MRQDQIPDLNFLYFRLQQPKTTIQKATPFPPEKHYLDNHSNHHYSQIQYPNNIQADSFQLSRESLEISKNPFLRTNHLFNSGVKGKQTYIQQKKLQQTFPEQITLFDSFGKMSEGDGQSDQLPDSNQNLQSDVCFGALSEKVQYGENLSALYDSNSNEIKIWQEYSVINDDYEHPPSNVRASSRCPTAPAADGSFFFLTQNDSRSDVKQFCFNLNDSTEKSIENQQLKEAHPNKLKLKKVIYEFLDRLDSIPEGNITDDHILMLRVIFKNGIQPDFTNSDPHKQYFQRELPCFNRKQNRTENSLYHGNSYQTRKITSRKSIPKKQIWRCPGKVINTANLKSVEKTVKTARKLF